MKTTKNLRIKKNFLIWIIRSKGEVIGYYGRNFQLNHGGNKKSQR